MSEIMKYQVQKAVAGAAAGVKHATNFIAEEVAPPANTGAEEFSYPTYSNEGMLDEETLREMDAEGDYVPTDAGWVDAKLDEHSKGSKIDIRKIRAAELQDKLRAASGNFGAGLSAVDRLRLARTRALMGIIARQKEKRVAAIVQNALNHFSGAATNLDFTAATILKDIETARKPVEDAHGVRLNCFILGYSHRQDLINNPVILERIEGGSTLENPAIVNDALLAKIFEVEKLLTPRAVTQTKAAPGAAPATSTPIWDIAKSELIFSDFGAAVDDLATPTFLRLFYADCPETGVPQNVVTWRSQNGKIEFIEVTEFFRPSFIMNAGCQFT